MDETNGLTDSILQSGDSSLQSTGFGSSGSDLILILEPVFSGFFGGLAILTRLRG